MSVLIEIEHAINHMIKALEGLRKDEKMQECPVLMLPPIHTGKVGTLREEQSNFALAVSHLIQFAYSKGYELTLGDAFRDERVHGGLGIKNSYSSANSRHKTRQAIDLNLFINGIYQTDTSAYKEMGDWWLKEYPNRASWGGKWGDGNHFSWLEF